MPIQRRIFGRNVPAITPRKMAALLATIAMFAVFTLVFTLPNSIPSGPSLSKFADHKISLPKLPQVPSPSILNPFAPSSHAPPVQENSTSGDSSWHSNWNWLSPFSSSVTLDESRSLLPPLAERPPIYAYYDHTSKKDKDLKAAESELLVTWRKAWWAQGFKPVILGPGEAHSNLMYKEFQLLDLEPVLKMELQRWLAWERMGTGVLCDYLLLPMTTHEDPLLAYLRRGKYPLLTRFDKLGGGLFIGSKAQITAAIKQVLGNNELKGVKDLVAAVTPDTFKIDPRHESLAYYDTVTIKDNYPGIASRIVDKDLKFTGAVGLGILNQLITAHLQLNWQNAFSQGIVVIKPASEHVTRLVEPAYHLAGLLVQCPVSPVLNSCPPNRPRCTPCTASSRPKISASDFYRNISGLYTIGTVPHPYTMAVLSSFKYDIDIRWIRRDSKRDQWVYRLTQEILGTEVSGIPRVVKFKDAVASQYGAAHSLWLTAEREIPADLDWYFGFSLPQSATKGGKSEKTAPKPGHEFSSGYVPENDSAYEEMLLQKAKEFGVAKGVEEKKIRAAIEAWNLADMEAWKFARAYMARNTVERLQWEEEESKYAGGAGAKSKKKEDSK